MYAVAARLGYTPSQLTGISTVHVYAAYGLDLESLTRLNFADPPRADASTWSQAVTVSEARAVAITPAGKLLLADRRGWRSKE